MTDRRYAAAAVAAGIVVGVGVAPPSAQAHGAPVNPVSRASVCAVGSPGEGMPACVAALEANGRPLGAFDNLRVPGVDGDDKATIPDGQLCSGGLRDYRGLDLARDDWPGTAVVAGATVSVRYRATIGHRGTFRFYLTKAGYDPTLPLRWQDLGTDPILTVTNPSLRDGAYRMSVRVPAELTGRHVLYTVWQTSRTPDTYYSCSDLDLTAAAAGSGGAAAAPSDRPAGQATDGATGAAPPSQAGAPTRESWLGRPQPIVDVPFRYGRQLVSGAVILLVGGIAGLITYRLRAGRRGKGAHRRVRRR
ncbi:MAG TPA: lytic polysaccharide monooxygenase [Actinoplanes sp.]|nr:lytic polysaccharide monooxygenase [Actinoplanes sp.]